jgi:hypothetical protein
MLLGGVACNEVARKAEKSTEKVDEQQRDGDRKATAEGGRRANAGCTI